MLKEKILEKGLEVNANDLVYAKTAT